MRAAGTTGFPATVLAPPAASTKLPSELTAASKSGDPSPLRSLSRPVRQFQTRATPSIPAVTTTVPLGAKAAAFDGPAPAGDVATVRPACQSQTRTVPSVPVPVSSIPSPEKAAEPSERTSPRQEETSLPVRHSQTESAPEAPATAR